MFNNTPGIRSMGLAVATVALAGLGLSACGGSSSSTATSANAGAGSSAKGATGGATGHSGVDHLAGLRECLQKNGVTLPSRPNAGGGGPGSFLGGGAAGGTLPNGVSHAQFEAALKKCGVSHVPRPTTSTRGRVTSPGFRENLTKFAACMRENGVPLPPPNTSGTGSIFNTKGIDTKSAQFSSALAKCRSRLRPNFAPGAAQGTTGSG